MKKNQSGFGYIEVLLSIIALCLIVFVGYYIYHAHTSKTAKNNTSTTSTTTVKKPSVSDPNLIADAAAAQTKTIYDDYYAKLEAGDDVSTYFDNHPQYFTSRFTQVVDNTTGQGNPMICGQQLTYDSLSVSNPVLSGSTAVVTVNENFNDASQQGNSVKVTMAYQSGKWLLDGTDCGTVKF
ncbi:MAG: hypothetical protein WA843_04350 [Candidatus Saccharimonadales bacterium]